MAANSNSKKIPESVFDWSEESSSMLDRSTLTSQQKRRKVTASTPGGTPTTPRRKKGKRLSTEDVLSSFSPHRDGRRGETGVKGSSKKKLGTPVTVQKSRVLRGGGSSGAHSVSAGCSSPQKTKLGTPLRNTRALSRGSACGVKGASGGVASPRMEISRETGGHDQGMATPSRNISEHCAGSLVLTSPSRWPEQEVRGEEVRVAGRRALVAGRTGKVQGASPCWPALHSAEEVLDMLPSPYKHRGDLPYDVGPGDEEEEEVLPFVSTPSRSRRAGVTRQQERSRAGTEEVVEAIETILATAMLPAEEVVVGSRSAGGGGTPRKKRGRPRLDEAVGLSDDYDVGVSEAEVVGAVEAVFQAVMSPQASLAKTPEKATRGTPRGQRSAGGGGTPQKKRGRPRLDEAVDVSDAEVVGAIETVLQAAVLSQTGLGRTLEKAARGTPWGKGGRPNVGVPLRTAVVGAIGRETRGEQWTEGTLPVTPQKSQRSIAIGRGGALQEKGQEGTILSTPQKGPAEVIVSTPEGKRRGRPKKMGVPVTPQKGPVEARGRGTGEAAASLESGGKRQRQGASAVGERREGGKEEELVITSQKDREGKDEGSALTVQTRAGLRRKETGMSSATATPWRTFMREKRDEERVVEKGVEQGEEPAERAAPQRKSRRLRGGDGRGELAAAEATPRDQPATPRGKSWKVLKGVDLDAESMTPQRDPASDVANQTVTPRRSERRRKEDSLVVVPQVTPGKDTLSQLATPRRSEKGVAGGSSSEAEKRVVTPRRKSGRLEKDRGTNEQSTPKVPTGLQKEDPGNGDKVTAPPRRRGRPRKEACILITSQSTWHSSTGTGRKRKLSSDDDDGGGEDDDDDDGDEDGSRSERQLRKTPRRRGGGRGGRRGGRGRGHFDGARKRNLAADQRFSPTSPFSEVSSEEEEEEEEETYAPPERTRTAKKRKTETPTRKGRKPRGDLVIPDRKGFGVKNKFEEVKERLHLSAVPKSLPCREEEFNSICSFVEGHVIAGTGGCMCISGVPGTGKTATVLEVAASLQEAAEEGSLPAFKFVEVNGMRLTEPKQVYVTILKQLTGKKASPDHACVLLGAYFRKERTPTVLLVDELDLLCTGRKQKVMYNLMDWPSQPHSRLVVLGVANTMDLPERVLQNKISSRMGKPERLTFEAYTFQQLREIVSARVSGLNLFDQDVIELAVRKVAAVSGDVRRALDLLLRATEIAQSTAGCQSVGLPHLLQAIEEVFSSPKILAVKHASLYEKLFLRGVLAQFRRSGLEEATLREVYEQVREQFAVEGVKLDGSDVLDDVCVRLGVCKILLVEEGNKDIHRKICINMSQTDILLGLNS